MNLGVFRILAALGALAIGAAQAADVDAPAATARVELRAVDDVYVSDALIEAVRQATVSAQITGTVTEVMVDAGDRVKKGQLLARIDARETDAQLAARRAGVAQAEALMVQARQNHERNRSLVDKNFISQAALDKSEADYRAARAELEAARAASVQASTARSFAEVRAPIDGVVTQRLLETGELAVPGKPVVAVHDPAALRAVGTIPQFVLSRAGKVSAARVVVPAPQRVLDATKVTVLPSADPRLLSTQVRADLPAGDVAGVAPGSAAKILLKLGTAQKLVVPETALIRRGELTAVKVVAGGRLRLRQVRVGPSTGTGLVEVLAGLSAGEQVAIQKSAETQ